MAQEKHDSSKLQIMDIVETLVLQSIVFSC